MGSNCSWMIKGIKMWETYTIEYHSDIKQRILSSANKTERAGGHWAVWNKPERERKERKSECIPLYSHGMKVYLKREEYKQIVTRDRVGQG